MAVSQPSTSSASATAPVHALAREVARESWAQRAALVAQLHTCAHVYAKAGMNDRARAAAVEAPSTAAQGHRRVEPLALPASALPAGVSAISMHDTVHTIAAGVRVQTLRFCEHVALFFAALAELPVTDPDGSADTNSHAKLEFTRNLRSMLRELDFLQRVPLMCQALEIPLDRVTLNPFLTRHALREFASPAPKLTVFLMRATLTMLLHSMSVDAALQRGDAPQLGRLCVREPASMCLPSAEAAAQTELLFQEALVCTVDAPHGEPSDSITHEYVTQLLQQAQVAGTVLAFRYSVATRWLWHVAVTADVPLPPTYLKHVLQAWAAGLDVLLPDSCAAAEVRATRDTDVMFSTHPSLMLRWFGIDIADATEMEHPAVFLKAIRAAAPSIKQLQQRGASRAATKAAPAAVNHSAPHTHAVPTSQRGSRMRAAIAPLYVDTRLSRIDSTSRGSQRATIPTPLATNGSSRSFGSARVSLQSPRRGHPVHASTEQVMSPHLLVQRTRDEAARARSSSKSSAARLENTPYASSARTASFRRQGSRARALSSTSATAVGIRSTESSSTPALSATTSAGGALSSPRSRRSLSAKQKSTTSQQRRRNGSKPRRQASSSRDGKSISVDAGVREPSSSSSIFGSLSVAAAASPAATSHALSPRDERVATYTHFDSPLSSPQPRLLTPGTWGLANDVATAVRSSSTTVAPSYQPLTAQYINSLRSAAADATSRRTAPPPTFKLPSLSVSSSFDVLRQSKGAVVPVEVPTYTSTMMTTDAAFPAAPAETPIASSLNVLNASMADFMQRMDALKSSLLTRVGLVSGTAPHERTGGRAL